VLGVCLFFPARVLSESFQWINDKINGNQPYGKYFDPNYLMGQAAPASSTPPYNPVNMIQYGEPGYTPPGYYHSVSIPVPSTTMRKPVYYKPVYSRKWVGFGAEGGQGSFDGKKWKRNKSSSSWGHWEIHKELVPIYNSLPRDIKNTTLNSLGNLELGYNMAVDGSLNASIFAKGFGTGLTGLSFFANMYQIYNQYNQGHINPFTAANAGVNFVGLTSKILSWTPLGGGAVSLVGRAAGFAGIGITAAESWWAIYKGMNELRFAPLSIDHTTGEPYFGDPEYYFKSIDERW
jgi:hypothetical protein